MAFSGKIVPDIIFNDCSPSLAVITCTGMKQLGSIVERAEIMSKQFRNAVLIAIGFEDNERWNQLQIAIEGDCLRILRVSTITEAAQVIMKCRNVMGDANKIAKQEEYFCREETRIISSHAARGLIYDVMNSLSIPEEDAQLLAEGFPSIAQLICTRREVMETNCPASFESINLLTTFFGNK